MQVSTTSLFKGIKEDQKQTKELPKSSIQKELMQIDNSSKPNQNASFKSIDKLLNSLFFKISNGTISKSEAAKIVQNSAAFKQNNSSMEGLKNLLALLDKEPKLSRFVAPIKEFIQHISTSNASSMNQQIKNSGIGLEATLAKNFLLTKLPASTRTLLSNIVKELNNLPQEKLVKALEQNPFKNSKQPNIMQDITQNVKNEAKTLLLQKSVSREDLQSLQKNLSKIVQNLISKESMANIPKELKALFSTIGKLNTNASEQEINSFAKEATKKINSLSSFIASSKPTNKAETLKFQETLKEIQTILKSIENKPLTNQDKQILSTLATQLTIQNSSPTIPSATNLTTQEQIQLLSLKLKQSMNMAEKQLAQVSKNETTLKNFAQILQKEIPKFASKESLKLDPLQIAKKDIKQTLLQLSDATSSTTSQAQKEIHTLANKSLTNIQMHQLISYAQSSLSTYIPYTWDEIKDGNIAFKKIKEESFYCQINVELKQHGKVNVMLMLTEDKYLNISIATEKETFKEVIEKNLPLLKIALYKVGLTPLKLSLKPLQENSYSKEEWSDFSLSLKV